MRDDFPASVRELLAKRVGQRCSNPGCRRSTSGPHEDPTKAVNVGVAAHLSAASPGGPRYDESLSTKYRRSEANGIWLCQTCAKLIDSDTNRYTIEVLRCWRTDAEATATRALETLKQLDGSFTRLERLVPDLLAEMRNDLTHNPFRREFVLLKRCWSYWGSDTEFIYYFDDHPELEGKVRILQNAGLVEEITEANVRRFAISEALVTYLVPDLA